MTTAKWALTKKLIEATVTTKFQGLYEGDEIGLDGSAVLAYLVDNGTLCVDSPFREPGDMEFTISSPRLKGNSPDNHSSVIFDHLAKVCKENGWECEQLEPKPFPGLLVSDGNAKIEIQAHAFNGFANPLITLGDMKHRSLYDILAYKLYRITRINSRHPESLYKPRDLPDNQLLSNADIKEGETYRPLIDLNNPEIIQKLRLAMVVTYGTNKEDDREVDLAGFLPTAENLAVIAKKFADHNIPATENSIKEQLVSYKAFINAIFPETKKNFSGKPSDYFTPAEKAFIEAAISPIYHDNLQDYLRPRFAQMQPNYPNLNWDASLMDTLSTNGFLQKAIKRNLNMQQNKKIAAAAVVGTPDFGPEGTLYQFPSKEYAELSKKTFQEILINTAYLINPELNEPWVIRAKSNLLETVLGDKESYDVPECLAFLRKIETASKTSEQRLVQRALAIANCDLLNPVSIKKQSVRNLYEDLGFNDPAILPEGRIGGAVSFYKFKYYQDSERRLQLHIYPEKGDEGALKKEFPHEHPGDSASIILLGAVTNKHITPVRVDSGTAEYGLCDVERDAVFAGRGQRVGKALVRKNFVNFLSATQHTYVPGEQYLLPAPPKGRKFTDDAIETDKLTWHTVETEPGTVTLFGQKFSGGKESTTRKASDPEIIPLTYNQVNRTLTPQEAGEMLAHYHPKILETLGQVRKPSTILDRTEGKTHEILCERLGISPTKQTARG